MRVLIRHPLFPQHLLKDTTKLLFREPVVGFLGVAGGRAAETKGGPGEALCEAAACSCARTRISWDVFFEIRVRGCGAACETVVGACGVVVAAPCRV